MQKTYVKTACLIGALSVVLGAFAAHALKGQIPENAVNIFETGVRYQFYHVFALLATGILYQNFPNKLIKWAGILVPADNHQGDCFNRVRLGRCYHSSWRVVFYPGMDIFIRRL